MIAADNMECEFRLIFDIILIQYWVIHLILVYNHQILAGIMSFLLLITFMYKGLLDLTFLDDPRRWQNWLKGQIRGKIEKVQKIYFVRHE